MPNEIIDAHQHNWELARFAYSWLNPDKAPLYRDYLPTEIVPQMQQSGVTGCVLVQADTSLAESQWLLELAEVYPHILGVVGWVDATAPDLAETLASFSQNANYKGIRPPIPAFEANWDIFANNLKLLANFNLSCDLLVKPAMYTKVYELIRQTPDVTFILDHFAGAAISLDKAAFSSWQTGLKPLAALPNVIMKLSGYFSAPGRAAITVTELRPYFEAALELIGAARLMFGSDYPVCTRGGSYAEVVSILQQLSQELSSAEQTALWSQTARRVYRL